MREIGAGARLVRDEMRAGDDWLGIGMRLGLGLVSWLGTGTILGLGLGWLGIGMRLGLGLGINIQGLFSCRALCNSSFSLLFFLFLPFSS